MKAMMGRAKWKKMRKAEKKRLLFPLANVLVQLVVLAALGFASVTLPKPTVSLVEKRDLAPLPAFSAQTFFSGQYIRDLEAFYADTFPLRENFVELSALWEDVKGVRPDEIKIYEQSPQEPTEPAPEEGSLSQSPTDVTNVPESTTPAARDYEPNSLAEGEVSQLGATFICKDRALTLFGGNRPVGLRYAQVLNNYASALEGKVKVYNLIVPTAVEFGLPDQYQNLSASQRDNIDYIYENLSPLITTVDAHGEIAKHYYNEYCYFRTDHHWTGLGAYYAYRAFAQSAGFTPHELSDYDIRRQEDTFLGTLFGMTQDSKLREHPDYVEYYVNPTASQAYIYQKGRPNTPIQRDVLALYAKGGNSYSLFLHGDWPLMRIDTGCRNGRRIVVIKESFGNAFVPFLIDHYEQIFVVDQRHFQTSLTDLVEKNDIQEMLFINNIFAANTSYHVECIRSLQYQVYTPAPAPAPKDEASSKSEEPVIIIVPTE